ncbi:MAG: ABC transporter ATP-binding protein [Candidatus Taylorbacteria bacterium]|nr:ABC transporter ATP-binding protein [Candidatus Taylorbacteria bacterium]
MNYPKVTTWQIFKEYWKYAKKYFFYGLVIFIGISLGTLIQSVLVPIFYKKFFDFLQYSVDAHNTANLLVKVILSIAVLNGIGWIFNRLAKFLLVKFEVSVMRDVRQSSYDYVLEHSHNFFTNNFTGSLVQKINRYTRAFERLADRFLMDITPLAIKIIGASIVLNTIDRRIALGIIIWIAIFLTISFIFNRIKLKYDTKAAVVDSKVAATLSDSMSNHSAVQLFTGEKNESKYFGVVNSEFATIYSKRWNTGEKIDTIQSFLNLAVEFFIFYYAIKYWEVGLITIGTFALAQAYIISIGGSLWGFGRIVRDLYEATADAREMVEILKLPHEIQDISNAPRLHVKSGSIEFKNITFAFGQNKSVFTNLSLMITAGEKVALIGSSGAGKSTFVKLLLRLHDIQSGEILVDGQNIKEVTQNSLRENISLVPQDPALFHRTLMENIRYGRRTATDEQVIGASKLAHCDIFIKEFPQQYETLVGERGVKLSGGERQRVAIARALLKNAPILVLDEATSSLDSHSESLIQDALHTLMKGKTTLVIAHRLSTIRKMDRIIVLGKTGILEEGSHDELVSKNGTYAHLWSLQAGGFNDKSIEDMLDE